MYSDPLDVLEFLGVDEERVDPECPFDLRQRHEELHRPEFIALLRAITAAPAGEDVTGISCVLFRIRVAQFGPRRTLVRTTGRAAGLISITL